MLTPEGKPAAFIPANESVKFTVKIDNFGESPVRVYGMIIKVYYDGIGLSYGVSDDRLIQPGGSVELGFVFAADFPRPADIDVARIVVSVYGEGWNQEQTVPIYLAH